MKSFSEGYYREATGLLQEALRQNVKNDSAYYYLGMIDLPLARNSPSYAAAHWRMGMVYEKLGNKDSAKIQYNKALQLDPGMEEAKKSLANLK